MTTENHSSVTAKVWRVVGYRLVQYQAAPGAPVQCGATCERCGQAIMNVYTVEHVNGDRMIVGPDCAVSLEGGPEMAELKAVEAATRLAERMEATEKRREAERKTLAERLAAVAKRNEVEFAGLLAECDEIAASEKCSEWERKFAADIAADIRRGARDWPLSTQSTESGFIEEVAFRTALLVARLPDAKHLDAAPGARTTVTATLTRLHSYVVDGPFHGEVRRIATFRTDDGACLVWRTGSSVGYTDEEGRYHAVRLGGRVDLTGTVKSHGDFRGVPQTEIQRCKLAPEGTAKTKPAKKGRKKA